MKHVCALFLLLLAASPLLASSEVYDSFMARAVRVKDGDSVIVRRLDSKGLDEIRLAGIDAPELHQPWGRQAKAALTRLLSGKDVRVDVVDRDRYFRLVAKLFVGKAYVNAEMARTGNAWAFARYMPDPRIRAAHDAARAARRGLWSLPKEQQLPPATWRMTHPWKSTAAKATPAQSRKGQK